MYSSSVVYWFILISVCGWRVEEQPMADAAAAFDPLQAGEGARGGRHLFRITKSHCVTE